MDLSDDVQYLTASGTVPRATYQGKQNLRHTVNINGDWRIKYNDKLYNMYTYGTIAQKIKMQWCVAWSSVQDGLESSERLTISYSLTEDLKSDVVPCIESMYISMS